MGGRRHQGDPRLHGPRGGGAPYGAVLSLTEWAAQHLTAIDGKLLREGIELEDLLRGPARRYVAVLYSLYTEAVSGLKPEEREKALALVEWPDLVEERDSQRVNQEAAAALAAYGVTVDIGRALAAREAAMQREAQAVSNNDTVTTGADA